MIEPIARVFGEIISFIYGIVPNFGIAIIILTILVKMITFPLNNKQIQSTKKMQLLQPEIKKIQQKYKDDKEKQNRAMQEFMKENNYNPLSGCLPLLVQFPILIGMFRLLRDVEMFIGDKIESFSPYLFPATEFIDLTSTPEVTMATFLSQVSIYYIFPIIAGLTTYMQSKMQTPAQASGESSQKMMLYMMPIMITVFSFTFPTGLVIYWIMNNVFSIGQHKLVLYLDDQKNIENEKIIGSDKDSKEFDKTAESKKNTDSQSKQSDKKVKTDTKPAVKAKAKRKKGKK